MPPTGSPHSPAALWVARGYCVITGLVVGQIASSM
jgi:hypothetical protein